MNAQHTPGPWTIDDISAEGGGWESIVILSKIQRADHNFHHVCSVDWGGSDDDEPAIGEISGEDRANARLIAASPELLEACEGLLQIVQDCMPSCKFEDHGCHEIVKLASEAIATAKGTDGWRVLQENFEKMTPEQALDWWGLECVDYEKEEMR